MQKIMLSGKIHNARLTACMLDYEGSLEIDPELLEEAGLLSCNVIQYSAAPGMLVIQAIRDPELLREVYGEEGV